jgi:hypothetical protein
MSDYKNNNDTPKTEKPPLPQAPRPEVLYETFSEKTSKSDNSTKEK